MDSPGYEAGSSELYYNELGTSIFSENPPKGAIDRYGHPHGCLPDSLQQDNVNIWQTSEKLILGGYFRKAR